MSQIQSSAPNIGDNQPKLKDNVLPTILDAQRNLLILNSLLSLSADKLSSELLSLPEKERDEIIAALKETSKISDKAGILVGEIAENDFISEKKRSPTTEELKKLDLSRAIIFKKRSKVEYDLDQRGVSYEELLKMYSEENIDIKRVLSADKAHKESINQLLKTFDNKVQIKTLDLLPDNDIAELLKNSSLVISIGGDDHFKAVARHVTDQLVVIINSDPVCSNGVLTKFTSESFPELFEKLKNGEFLIEEWQRLSAEVQLNSSKENIKKLPSAISEICIHDHIGDYTMRGSIEHNGKEIKLKGTGLIVATGAGSTGWFTSAAKYLFPLGRKWSRTESYAEFVIREPYGSDSTKRDDFTGSIISGEELLVTSSSNHSPKVSIDSVYSEPLPRGSSVKIKLSDSALKVISNS